MKCVNCVNYKDEWCEKVIDSPHPDIERDCRHFVSKTNADHIRSMTDEELATYLAQAVLQQCPCPTKDCEALCNDCILNWLKQTHETYKED